MTLLPPPAMGYGERFELPSGGYFILKSSKVVTERQRRPLRSAMMRFSERARSVLQTLSEGDDIPIDAFEPHDLDVMFEINDLAAAALIAEASFVPPGERCTADLVADQPGDDYDRIVGAIGPRMGELLKGSNVDFDPNPDRSSPTLPSSG